MQLDWQTTLHSVELEPGLVRLALRNLLNNAIEHGGAGVQVRLVVAEQSTPPALLLRVLDNGSALDANLLLRLQSAPATSGSTSEVSSAASSVAGLARAKTDGSSADDQPPAAADTFSRGLGLALARRVMQLHGGELRFTPAQPQGLEACLVFPLPDE